MTQDNETDAPRCEKLYKINGFFDFLVDGGSPYVRPRKGAAGGGCGPRLKLASRVSRIYRKKNFAPYSEHALTHQDGLADLEAAAAAADPLPARD